uniref:Uncharacterized protein n=1 Tax=Eutreptiella gymnastica TaxID=73025 RepID=A0A7S1IJK9_9EUGL|mmetsp:Transcript_217/g.596  ORF Transcript_217/g.596 Transcript_217/m.596 type:complete len:140 (+) Transcript_217:696-1115(+)
MSAFKRERLMLASIPKHQDPFSSNSQSTIVPNDLPTIPTFAADLDDELGIPLLPLRSTSIKARFTAKLLTYTTVGLHPFRSQTFTPDPPSTLPPELPTSQAKAAKGALPRLHLDSVWTQGSFEMAEDNASPGGCRKARH